MTTNWSLDIVRDFYTQTKLTSLYGVSAQERLIETRIISSNLMRKKYAEGGSVINEHRRLCLQKWLTQILCERFRTFN